MLKSRVNPHNRPTPHVRLAQRMAAEKQLLAEEKWIIDALRKIKAEKNCVQIERLHLESVRAQAYQAYLAEMRGDSKDPSTYVPQETSSDEEMLSAFTNTQEAELDALPVEINTEEDTLDAFNLRPQNMDDFGLCNTMELNLSVTNSVFNTDIYGPPVYDEEEEDDDIDDCYVDISMLMMGDDGTSSAQAQKKPNAKRTKYNSDDN